MRSISETTRPLFATILCETCNLAAISALNNNGYKTLNIGKENNWT